METEIRDLLRERAEDVRAEPRIPPTVLRRAQRRRALNAAAAGILTAAVVAGVVVGTRVALDGQAPEPRRGAVVGRLGEYDGIYPETTATLRAIRAGRIPTDPWTTPQDVARHYAENILGWDTDEFVIGRVFPWGGRPRPILKTTILNTTTTLGPRSRIDLTMERWGDVYTVSSAESLAIEIDHPETSDTFRRGETVTVSGRLRFIPPTGSVEASLTSGTAGSGVAEPVARKGAFTLPINIPPLGDEPPVLAVTVHMPSGATLSVTSFRLGLDAGAPPAETLPDVVESTHTAIIEAARARDWEALRDLIPRNFSFTFGLAGDPISYWKDLAAEGEPILDTLATLLEGPWAPNEPTNEGRILYVWPGPAVKPAEDWTREDVAILRRIATEREIELYRDHGSYIGWRAGIWDDGTWASFIAGD
jgi:hypothetical protein